MTEIFRCRDSTKVGHLQSLLESEGIKTYYRNEYVSSTTIEIPEVAPALCILDDAEVDRGVDLIRDYLESPSVKVTEDQTCSNCGEGNPGTFAACWKCGASLEL